MIMNNTNNDGNIFFSLDENENLNTKKDDKDDNYDFTKMLDEFNNNNNNNNNISNEEIFEVMCFEYKLNYNVKELLLICEYYGIAKELRANKCNKEEIIIILVNFENNPINDDIVLKRKSMWFYMSQLKNDKFMKKYVLW
jgi:hypothetical protein